LPPASPDSTRWAATISSTRKVCTGAALIWPTATWS
jgi:hypothetical protein